VASRPGVLTGAALALLAACSGGDAGRAGAPPGPSSTAVNGPTPTVATPSSTTPATVVTPPGSATFTARGVVLADPATDAEGLRVLVGAAPSYTVRTRGRVPVEVCPAGPGGPPRPRPEGCVEPVGQEPSEVPGGPAATGVAVRQLPAPTGARRGPAALEEVTVTYRPSGRAITLVVPPRGPGACGADECEATFELAPTGAGTFSLEARPQGGRPQLSLLSGPADRPGSRSLATVEGASSLSVRATVEAGSAPRLVFREKDPGQAPALAVELFWP
jgi:hypothetical protein